MSAERDTPRGPSSEQLRRRVHEYVAAAAVFTDEDQTTSGLSTADAERWRRRWDAVPWPPPPPHAYASLHSRLRHTGTLTARRL